MLEFLYKIFIGHVHRYEMIEEINIMNTDSDSDSDIPKAKCYVMQCQVCGKLKEFRVKG